MSLFFCQTLLAQASLQASLPFSIPGIPQQYTLPLVGGAGFLALALVFFLLFRPRAKKIDPEAGLVEDLATYPAAPKGQRHYQLLVMNQAVRLRLVVIAPVGKRPVGKVDSALEQVFRGLGEVSFDDRPRVRIWPPQLSSAGFAPSFFRLTRRPEKPEQPSRWILLAGPAQAGGMPILLGLVVEADSLSRIGSVVMTETKWAELLRVENA